MAPIRKFSNLNKLSFKDNKESPTKDAHNRDASSQQKRKTTDLSGPQWSKEELGRFYDAYRKYGKNWKKVAGIVRGRSVEMVEALYNVNRAYLSLPDGAASVAGLIAMMTDHYSTLDSDESGRECNEQPKISRKAQKRDRGKSRGNMSKSTAGHVPHKLQSQAVASNYGCLSLLKSTGPRIVGKRTPRISISHPYSKGDLQKHLSPSKHDPSSEEDVNADEIAEGELSLAKVLQGESSSHTSNRRVKLTRMSPVRGCGKIYAEAVMFGDKHIGAAKEDWGKGKLGMRVTGNADLTEDGVNTVEVCRKRKKFHKSKTNLQDSRYPSAARDSCRIKKRRKQILSEDEYTAMDVLSILKDLPSKLEPTSTMESGPKENGDKHAMDGEDSDLDVGLTPEAKQQMHQSTSIMNRRKRKTLSSKIPKAEPEMNSLHSKQKRTEIPKSDSLVSCRLSEQQITEQKPVGPQKSASQKDDFLGQGNHLASSTVQAPIADQIKLQTKQRSRRKMLPQKMLIPNSSENIGNGQSKKSPSSLLKEKLSNCLSSGTLQRWCAFEWFYSAIDYPWFAEREFVEYLNHVGLGHVPKLTRVEWGVIRSSLGKPRRLSQQFLKEEKDKLERYRESVRNHYAELRSGITEAIPSDLARPLRVGQRVIARHPKTRGIYDGSILTVECNKCRVQFDRLELGVELVMDIDCMPLNLVDNMPEALRKERIPVDKDQRKFNESINPKVAGHMKYASSENLESADGSPLISSPAHPVNTFLKPTKGDTSGDKALTSTSDKAQGITQRQSSNLLQIHSRDTDIRALADLKCALDKKEMLVLELKYMNCEVLKNQNDGDESLKTSEHFKMQYASVLLQLKEVNDQVSSALLYMRQRNTFQENSSRPWLKPMGKSSNPTEENFASLAQESGSNVVEVVESSRWKAQKMVDVAAEAVSSLKHGEDVYKKIGEALDYTNGQDFGVDSMPPMRSNTSNQGDHDLPCPNQGTSGMAEQRTTDQTSVSMLNNPTEVTKVEIPSALISSCVATLLMIQRCTDRQCPPGEAVQILDSALTSLQPCCSQNLPIYRDIQMCMGMVKNQILALIPT